MRLINKREYNQFSRIFGPQIYGYLTAIILLACLGTIFQVYFCKLDDNFEKSNKTEDKLNVHVVENNEIKEDQLKINGIKHEEK